MVLMDAITYFAVLASLTVAPGPLSAILVAKTLAGDKSGAMIFGAGIALGDTLIILLVCSGMATWLESTPVVFTLGKALAIAYILWIALWMLRKDKPVQTNILPSSKRFFAELGSGAATCVASPQTLLLYLVLVPRLIDLKDIELSPFLVLLATTAAALCASIFAIIFLAEYIRHWVGPRPNRSVGDWILAAVVAGSGLSIIVL